MSNGAINTSAYACNLLEPCWYGPHSLSQWQTSPQAKHADRRSMLCMILGGLPFHRRQRAPQWCASCGPTPSATSRPWCPWVDAASLCTHGGDWNPAQTLQKAKVIYWKDFRLSSLTPFLSQTSHVCDKTHSHLPDGCQVGIVDPILGACGKVYIRETYACINDRLTTHKRDFWNRASKSLLNWHCSFCPNCCLKWYITEV